MHATLIDSATLARHLDDPAFVIVDVCHDLTRPDFGRAHYAAGHLPGARFASLDDDLSAPKNGRNGRHPLPSPQTAAALFGRLGIAPGVQVIAYDQGPGMYAARLWWMLRWLGHDTVAVLDGGYARWQQEGRPLTTDTPAVTPAAFVARALLPTASARDVLDSLAAHSRFIIDARLPERFRGDSEPMDPVAGHIPGAHNWPYTRNLNADGTFLAPAALKSAFAEFLGPTPADKLIHQCGSGVTACHNILAMAHAGYPLTRLYPGSWSEWVADPARPVETGG